MSICYTYFAVFSQDQVRRMHGEKRENSRWKPIFNAEILTFSLLLLLLLHKDIWHFKLATYGQVWRFFLLAHSLDAWAMMMVESCQNMNGNKARHFSNRENWFARNMLLNMMLSSTNTIEVRKINSCVNLCSTSWYRRHRLLGCSMEPNELDLSVLTVCVCVCAVLSRPTRHTILTKPNLREWASRCLVCGRSVAVNGIENVGKKNSVSEYFTHHHRKQTRHYTLGCCFYFFLISHYKRIRKSKKFTCRM